VIDGETFLNFTKQIFFLAVLEFELRVYTFSHSASPFLQSVFSRLGSLGTICQVDSEPQSS
jgi:hypothetical protein